jgi:hypothetical protein
MCTSEGRDTLKLIMGFIILGAVLWFFSSMFKKGGTGTAAATAPAPTSSGTA